MTELVTRPAPPRAPLPRRAVPALLGYAAIRVLGLAVLAIWSAARGKDAYTLLTARWDSLWYARVAASGYGYEVRLPNGDVHSDLAFFPLLPWLERLGHAVAPLSYADAGFVVALLASSAAAGGIFAVADRLYGARAGVCAVLLWAVLPVGVVQSMAYSESLFTALAAWSLYAVLTGRWVTAGLLAALAGLTRPVGMAVVAAVWVAGLASYMAGRTSPSAASPVTSFEGTRSAGDAQGAHEDVRAPGLSPAPGADTPARRLLGLALAPLGAAGYVLWVGLRTGDGPFGYLRVQAGWRNGFDGGYAFARFVAGMFTSFPSVLGGAVLVVGVVLLIRLYLTGVRQRQPLPVLVYTGVVLALALCASSYFGSKPRLLMPAFPVLFPLARALAAARPARAAALVAVVATVAAVYGALWLNGSGPP
ncbi:glycosyltransferase family 39 protein [Streptomyces sp. NPDC004549]|uniref:glycosyltransferase family 39 protein n=1 Tax=Streptomyces sp. NPDC004549 TaxID=3154283 RepID=UPI0033AF5EF5